MRALRAAQQGFTLVELVVVMLIIGIIGGIAAETSPSATLNLGAQADQLASDLRYTQMLELTRGASYCLKVTATGYQILGNACTTAVSNPGSGLGNETFAAGVSAAVSNLPNNYVAFFGPGVPYSSQSAALTATATITLSSGGVSRVISVSPQTGYVVEQ